MARQFLAPGQAVPATPPVMPKPVSLMIPRRPSQPKKGRA